MTFKWWKNTYLIHKRTNITLLNYLKRIKVLKLICFMILIRSFAIFGKINRCLDFYSILTTEIYINKNRGSFNLIYVIRLKINSCFVAYPSRNSAFLPRPSSAAKFVPSHHWRFNGSFLSPTYNDCIMYGIECG